MWLNGMELWYVRLITEVEVQVKIYEQMWDHGKVEMGNAYHTRDEAEVRAAQLRTLLKSDLPKIVKEQSHVSN